MAAELLVNLLVVEQDNESLADSFRVLQRRVGGAVKDAAITAATTAGGAAVGAAVGSVIPGIGTAVGAAVGALAGATYDEIVAAITEGLGNEVFTPRVLKLIVEEPRYLETHPMIGVPQTISIEEYGAKYTLEFDWHLWYGWAPWFQIHPETVFDHTTATVTALARTADHIDLFTIGFDNAVWSTYWDSAGAGWAPWFQIHPETVFDHTTASVTALARTADHIDLFTIGFDNAVWSTYWDSAAPGWAPWFQIHPETVFDHTTASVTALARTADHIDLFTIGFDNAVWSTYWDSAAPGWAPWFQIHPETVFDHTTATVTALARTADHIDLFTIGFDNAVWSTYWDSAAPGWAPWFQIHPETVFDHTTATVTALARTADHIDLFTIGFDNAVWSTYWDSAAPGWAPWFQIHPETVFDHTTATVTALARTADHIDLFTIGFDNAVWSTYWDSAAPGWAPWFQIHPETVFDHTTATVTALARTADHIDLFTIGFDNAVWSTYWEVGG